ncbi:MAG: branched-chain amino acid ABC transporter permease [Pseudomonadota bacterium]
MLTDITIQVLNALALSSILLLCSIGLTMIFGIMGVINFAHGSFYMLGAYVGFSIIKMSGSYWLALIISPLLVGLVGAFLELTTLRFIYLRSHFYQLLLTFGFLLALDALAQTIWGTDFKEVPVPDLLKGSVHILGTMYPIYRLFMLGLTAGVTIGLVVCLQKTKIGISIRAVSQDSEMAAGIGINVNMVRTLVFGAGCALAALGGVVIAPIVSGSLGMGVAILIQAFVVVVIGGLGSILGSVVGSLIVGTSQSYGTYLFPEGAMVFMYAMMAFILIFRTRGLFGEEE